MLVQDVASTIGDRLELFGKRCHHLSGGRIERAVPAEARGRELRQCDGDEGQCSADAPPSGLRSFWVWESEDVERLHESAPELRRQRAEEPALVGRQIWSFPLERRDTLHCETVDRAQQGVDVRKRRGDPPLLIGIESLTDRNPVGVPSRRWIVHVVNPYVANGRPALAMEFASTTIRQCRRSDNGRWDR